ncbi:MAG: hypothetical protein CMJ78_07685 [Planctomycetaceae bacterium]|nr:hypothetical protein [Planctomycetaceae bacterium]
MRISLILIAILSTVAAANAQPQPAQRPPEPKSPVDAKMSFDYFQIASGYKIELAASEPNVVDPVAVRFDEAGRMWVVEMRDYPNGPSAGQPPMSRIKVLDDKDHDGFYETSTVFADKLLFATGLQPWKGGVIVTMAGEVAYMKDTDGDGKADHREKWFTGFAEDNPQLRANHPTLALDNHVYISNGLRGGEILDHRSEGRIPIPLRGMDFRFDPRSDRSEAVTGVGQFGLTFDNYGNRFVCSNRNPCKQIVIKDRYLKQNPLAAIPTLVNDVSPAGDSSRIFPISRAWTTSNLHAGQFTAACGVTIYRGDLMPSMTGNSFTCDPTGNLVHRDILKLAGATYTSKPAHDGFEFLASTDEWFRPVNMENGPDGALYVVDMYRAVIEHPRWVPEELKNRPDERYGDDRGRIYRVIPVKGQRRQHSSLAGQSPKELVQLLDHRNAWHRETAARLLIEQRDHGAILLDLKKLALAASTPIGRIRTLWLLHAIDQLDPKTLSWAAGDSNFRVRQQVVALAELQSSKVSVAPKASSLIGFQQALYFAAEQKSELQVLFSIAQQSIDDPWTQRALLLAVGKQAGALATQLLNESENTGDGSLLVALADQTSRSPDKRLQKQLLQAIVDHKGELSLQRRLLIAMIRRLPLLKVTGAAEDERLRDSVIAIFERAIQTAKDASAKSETRCEAIGLAAYHTDSVDALQQLTVDQDQAVRLTAINALSRKNAVASWKELLKRFPSDSPAIRRAVVNAMILRPERTELLLDEIENKRIKVAELDRGQTNRLLSHNDAKLAARAKVLLSNAIPADRQKVLADYKAALQLQANPVRGRDVFKKNCSVCHRIGDIGVDVAPNISDSRTKQPLQILTDVIQPNRAIDNNYVSYAVRTEDGQSLTGILTSETATSITLKQQEGKVTTLLRSDIEQLRSTGVSLMPEGLEKNISHQDMADLVSFIKNWRYLDGRTPFKK